MSFRVPDRWRVRSGPLASETSDGRNGAFTFESCEPGWNIAVIASDGTNADGQEALDTEWLGWEHVSARAFRGSQSRTPTWKEMCHVKDLFWDSEDVVMQLHPRRSQYVNNHPHVLHLWRHRERQIPEPPAILVGVLVTEQRA